MKNIIKMVGLFTLIGFSFFYTDKILQVIKEEDEIMIKLSSIEDNYKISPVDAIIYGNTIIPGMNGRFVNIDNSYNNMKNNGIYDDKLLVFDTIIPSISITNNKDKFIIKGNSNKNMVSIIFTLNNNLYFEKINELFSNKEAIANYFVSYNYLINNSTKIKEIANNEFYSYGNDGKYSPDNLLFSNNLLTRIRDKEAIYCLSNNFDNSTLELCSKNGLYTVVPTIYGGKTPYTNIKKELSNGSIIMLDINRETINELNIIIDYIKGKGYLITGLSELLSE